MKSYRKWSPASIVRVIRADRSFSLSQKNHSRRIVRKESCYERWSNRCTGCALYRLVLLEDRQPVGSFTSDALTTVTMLTTVTLSLPPKGYSAFWSVSQLDKAHFAFTQINWNVGLQVNRVMTGSSLNAIIETKNSKKIAYEIQLWRKSLKSNVKLTWRRNFSFYESNPSNICLKVHLIPEAFPKKLLSEATFFKLYRTKSYSIDENKSLEHLWKSCKVSNHLTSC